MIQQVAEVLSYRKLGDEYHSLTIVAPEMAESARPGQFVNLRPPPFRSFILRRPFSIYRVNRRGDWAATVEVVFDIRGPGSEYLSQLRSHAIVDLIGSGDDVDITSVGTSEEAFAALDEKAFDCMVLDLKLPDSTGFEVLEKLRAEKRFRDLPVVIYTGKDLTRREEMRLRKYADTIVIKDVNSPERLLEETSLFLHRVASHLPADSQRLIESFHVADEVFRGKKVLIVDDDVRNVFAVASILESRGMEVIYAENGRDGVETLKQNPDVDLVLMDIMMPGMDGYETMRAIRAMTGFEHVPIIALTAHAMAGEEQKCRSAGCDYYLAKPVDRVELINVLARLKSSHADEPGCFSIPFEDHLADPAAAQRTTPCASELNLDDPEIREIVELFIDRLDADLSRLEQALELQDWSALRHEAHSLKGTAAMVGFSRLSKAAGDLESTLEENLLETIESSMLDVRREAAAVTRPNQPPLALVAQ